MQEQINKKDSKVIQEIKQGLNQVDTFPVYTPELRWFEQLVLEEKQQIKKKFIKELSIFILVALFVISGIMLSLYHMPLIFVFLQIITTVFIGTYTGFRFMKKVNKV